MSAASSPGTAVPAKAGSAASLPAATSFRSRCWTNGAAATFPMSWLVSTLSCSSATAFNIRIVNVSVGSFSGRNMSETSALVRGVEEIWDAGFVVVVAAGNMGPKRGTITTPGISRKVITVGCSDDDRVVNVMGSRMSDYSGRDRPVPASVRPGYCSSGGCHHKLRQSERLLHRKKRHQYGHSLCFRCHCPAFGAESGNVQPRCKASFAGTCHRSWPPKKPARLGTSRYPQPFKIMYGFLIR